MTSITIGADPEVFVTDREGTPIPICGLLGGTKGNPLMISSRGGYLEDGVAAEINVTPSTSFYDVVNECHNVSNHILEKLSIASPERGWRLSRSTALEFSLSSLDAAGPEARRFGCAPEFDAYQSGRSCERVDSTSLATKRNTEWRFCGGHIHIGYKNLAPNIPEDAVALFCDLYIGNRLIGAGEKQGRRRSLYGLAGRYRPTSYGIEYRTPSNMWLHSPSASDAVASGIGYLTKLLSKSPSAVRAKWNSVRWKDVQEHINKEVWYDETAA